MDVGWGQANQPLAPIRLSASTSHSQPSGDYRLQRDEAGRMVNYLQSIILPSLFFAFAVNFII